MIKDSADTRFDGERLLRIVRSAELTPQEFKEAAKTLNGPELASLSTKDEPKGSFPDIADWAKALFDLQGGKAVRPSFGNVLLDRVSAKTSMAYGGANRYKKLAFMAVKDVIERGAFIYKGTKDQLEACFSSANVSVDGSENVVTVQVIVAPQSKRMNLHSVTLTENLRLMGVSGADSESPSGTSSSTSTGDVIKLLRELLNYKPGSVATNIQSKKAAMYDLAEQFKEQTGGDIAIADTKLAGQEGRRASGKVETDLYTAKQVPSNNNPLNVAPDNRIYLTVEGRKTFS